MMTAPLVLPFFLLPSCALSLCSHLVLLIAMWGIILVCLTDVPDGLLIFRALSVLDIHSERHAGNFNWIVLTEVFAVVDFLWFNVWSLVF